VKLVITGFPASRLNTGLIYSTITRGFNFYLYTFKSCLVLAKQHHQIVFVYIGLPMLFYQIFNSSRLLTLLI